MFNLFSLFRRKPATISALLVSFTELKNNLSKAADEANAAANAKLEAASVLHTEANELIADANRANRVAQNVGELLAEPQTDLFDPE